MGDVYDVIVLGAGPTGQNVAQRAVRGGLTAAIVECELVGGECSYWACMPSKALLRPVAAVAEASHVHGVAGARLDVPGVLARRDSFTHEWSDDGQVEWVKNAGISLVRGAGRITGERRVVVDMSPSGGAWGAGGYGGYGGRESPVPERRPPRSGMSHDTELAARHAVVVCTGTRAAVPAELADVRPWTSREATSAREVPGRLAVVGGGVVGCEMAAAWRALGARVTLLSRGRLLDRMPGFAGDLVAGGLRDAGVDVRLGVSVTAASRGGSGARGGVVVTLDDGTTVAADEVLAATGRAPRTDDIGLDSAGLIPGSWLDVDNTMRVHAVEGGWLYAAGDVNHLALLTHMGKYQARICGDAIAARASGLEPTVTDRSSVTCVPQVVFTIPEVATVGLTVRQAQARGMTVRVVEYEIGGVAGASLFADGYTGHAHMVIDENRRLVGMTLAGPGVGEMIHAATIAVAGGVTVDQLWHAVPAYPTMSEVWLRLLEAYGL